MKPPIYQLNLEESFGLKRETASETQGILVEVSNITSAQRINISFNLKHLSDEYRSQINIKKIVRELGTFRSASICKPHPKYPVGWVCMQVLMPLAHERTQ